MPNIIKVGQCFTELLKKITLAQFFVTRCSLIFMHVTRLQACRNSPEIGTDGRSDAVSLGVEVVADVHGVARFALVVIVVHR